MKWVVGILLLTACANATIPAPTAQSTATPIPVANGLLAPKFDSK